MKTARLRQPVVAPDAAAPLEELGQVAKVQKPLRPAQCRKHLRNALAEAFPEIVAGFLAEAKDGSVQHLKMVLELVEPKKRERSRSKGSAELMLDRFRRQIESE